MRYHLGYLIADPVLTIQLGVPAVSQTGFLIEAAMDRIPASAAGMIRRMLGVLDGIEEKMLEAVDRLAARELGEITLNPDEPDALEKEHDRWARRLANLLGVPLNPFSLSPLEAGKRSLSGPVIHA